MKRFDSTTVVLVAVIGAMALGILTTLVCYRARSPWQSWVIQRKQVSSRPPDEARAIVGSIDGGFQWNLDASSRRELAVSGWVASADPRVYVERLNILLDGEPTTNIATLYPRPDIASLYDRADFFLSGWRTSVDVHKLSVGKHILQAQACGSNGRCTSVSEVRLVLQ